MLTDSIKQRAELLRNEINLHNHKYYVLDDPAIDDGEYDSLMRELLRLEEKHPELRSIDSPTQRVGSPPADRFFEVRHPLPMLSLSNAFNHDELRSWHRRVSALLEGRDFNMVCELKIDGLAVALTYRNGHLDQGATRGDGYRGEDVTQNLRTIKTIPLGLLEECNETFEVRGEVYMPSAAFARLNHSRSERGEPLYANPRNTAAGTIRQLDSRITASRHLEIFIYALGYVESNKPIGTHWDTLQRLQGLGFRISPYNQICTSLDQVEDYYQRWIENRNKLPFEADGVVVKVNSLEFQDQLGVVGREPRWAVAYKFPSEKVVTRLINIGINVGRTGSLNPYAQLTPALVGGATVKMATLHNEEDIHRKDIRIGDWVTIERAGEVIPQVIGPVVDRRTGEERVFMMPERCPECETLVVKYPQDAMHRCPNPACPAQFLELLKHFVSKGAMDIDGLGEKWCEIIVDQGLIKDLADLYFLNKEQLLQLDRMGEKLATRILRNIDESKTRTLDRIIFSLGIMHIGAEMAAVLTQQFVSLENLANSTHEKLVDIPGVGPKIADSVVDYFGVEQNVEMINKLYEAGVRLTGDAEQTSGTLSPLRGYVFCLTGTLQSMTRSQAETRIKELGGSVSSNVTRNTTYLIFGSDAGSKLARARDLGTEILDEKQFEEMLSDLS